ncbi:MAG: hypothetical protein JNJ46_31145 [Myxococcales bacterium]|nr:hypothetical protein [Myxococcales bacterium]
MSDARPLLDHFVAHAPTAIVDVVKQCSAAERGQLEEQLASLEATARTAWPEFELSTANFMEWIAPRVALEAKSKNTMSDILSALRALHVSDLYLCCGCAARSAVALMLFEQRCLPLIEAPLRRNHHSPDRVDEIKQQLRTHLFTSPSGNRGKIVDFEGRGSLSAWLRVAAVRIALNMQRADNRHVLVSEVPSGAMLPAGSDPTLDFIKHHHREACQSAIEEALRSLSREDRTLLRLHFVDALNIDVLGAMLHIHRATAARRLASARERLAVETRRLLIARLHIAPDEFESLMRLVKSSLQLSLPGLLSSQHPKT